MMVGCGMTPVDALRAGTSTAAKLLGEDGLRGTLEVGKSADLLLLDGNPLEDFGALHRIAAVFQDGRRVA